MADITTDFVHASQLPTKYTSTQKTPCCAPNPNLNGRRARYPRTSPNCHLLSHLATVLAHTTFARRRSTDARFAFKDFPELQALISS
jgi:hypothetical protein